MSSVISKHTSNRGDTHERRRRRPSAARREAWQPQIHQDERLLVGLTSPSPVILERLIQVAYGKVPHAAMKAFGEGVSRDMTKKPRCVPKRG